MKIFLFFAGVVLIIDLQAGCFLACLKLLPKLFQSWSIGLDPFLSECLVPPYGLLILEGRKCLEHTTVDLDAGREKMLRAYYSGFSDFETIFAILPFY